MRAPARTLRLSLFFLVPSFLFLPRLPAADLPRIDPREAGFSPERLKDIHVFVAKAIDEKRIAGAVTLITRGGKVVWLDAAGEADDGKPMRPDAIFRIASMTKPLTSVAAMALADEGKLSLDDKVSRYVPEFGGMEVIQIDGKDAQGKTRSHTAPADRDITVRDLLTHTSGLTYGFFGRDRLGEIYRKEGVSDGLRQTEGTLAENVRRLARCPLWRQPGKAWEYGLSTEVLGRVVEVAARKPLDEVFRDRIFRPLRMDDTHFFLPDEKRPRLAALYRTGGERKLERLGDAPVTADSLTYSATFQYVGPRTYFSPGAGLVSTAFDYARFLEMILRKGELDGARVLRAETVDLMTQNQVGDLDVWIKAHGDGFGYGFGVVTERGREKSPAPPGTASWGGIFYTYFWADPRNHIAGLFLSQVYPMPEPSLHEEFQRRTYAALLDAVR